MMEFGSFMEFPPAASGRDTAAFDQALDEVATAERIGLDVVWLAELHGAPERSVLSAPMMAAAAIAARTSTREVEEEIALDGILAELNCGGKIPQPRVCNAVKLLWEEVKPRFH